jgi:hypothetical protein
MPKPQVSIFKTIDGMLAVYGAATVMALAAAIRVVVINV